jgi:hypothetical protein
VLSEQLLAGLPFALKLSSHPHDDSPLLPDLDDLEISAEERCVLRAFTIDIALPLLFVRNADGATGKLVRRREISATQTYWFLDLADRLNDVGGLPLVGQVGPYRCVECNAEIPSAAKFLQQRGYLLVHGVSMRFAGAPPLERDAEIPRFVVDDPVFLVARKEHPIETILSWQNDQCHLRGELVRIPIQEGEHTLTVSTPDTSREYRYYGDSREGDSNLRICWIKLSSPEQTVQALVAGQLSLYIDAIAPLEGLELIVGLEAASNRFNVSMPLGPLPAVISGDSKLWESLLDDRVRMAILQDENPTLYARVGSLASGTWRLEQRLRSCWWDKNREVPTLCSELGPLEYGGVPAGHPLKDPVPGFSSENPEAVLLLPLDLDPSIFGETASFSGLCIAPSRLNRNLPNISKPELSRRRRCDSDAAIGVEDLVQSYLRWALAESASLTAEVRRRQVTELLEKWVCEACCGLEWAEREAALRGGEHDPWQLLIQACEKTGLGHDPFVDKNLSDTDQREVTRLGIAEIRRTIPELWIRVGLPCDLDTGDYDALDFACGRAYGHLAKRYEQLGEADRAAEIAGADPGRPLDEWQGELKRIKACTEMHELAELLLPSNAAMQLVSLDYTLLSCDDLTDELFQWSQKARPALIAAPERGIIETLLQLWIAPEKAIHGDWRGALNTLIVDRCIARAARYMSLRFRLQG